MPIYPVKKDRNFVFEMAADVPTREKYHIFDIRFAPDDVVKECLEIILIDIKIVRWDAVSIALADDPQLCDAAKQGVNLFRRPVLPVRNDVNYASIPPSPDHLPSDVEVDGSL